MTTTAMKRKSISAGGCPFGAKKAKVENGTGGGAGKKMKKLKVKKDGLKVKRNALTKDKIRKVKIKKGTAKKILEDTKQQHPVDNTPANKVVENFRQKLNQDSVPIDVIRHFTASLQQNPSYAVDYIRAGGTFKPLIKVLNALDKEKLSDIAELLTLIHYILIESVNYDETHADYAAKCAKSIITDYKPVIMSLLRTLQNEFHKSSAFRILKAVLLVDYSHGKDILKLLDVCLPDMEMLTVRESSANDSHESLRGVFIDFNLSFLIDTGADLTRAWLSRFLLVNPLVSNLLYDRAENVILVMKTFQQYVLECPEIDKYIYRTTFSTDILKALIHVYDWVGPPKANINEELRASVSNAVEKVVLPLLTSKKYHLVPKVTDLAKGSSRHKHILLALKNSKLGKHQRKLILKIFEVCPEVLPAVFENFGTLLKTKKPENQAFLLEILRAPKPKEIVPRFITADAKQVSNFVVKSTLPRTILEYVSSFIDSRPAICLEMLSVMLGQCEQYLQEITKLTNLDQFDQKKVKFDVINQILALFPTIDTIMFSMNSVRTNKLVSKPYIVMEYAMDILIACIRTFPSYIESSAFITTYRNILDPVYKNAALEQEYLSYEFKAIKVVIALEPQSIAFNSNLFPSVLKLLIKVYLHGNLEMQRESTQMLLSLFQNTSLFGNNPTEIEIWFQSLKQIEFTSAIFPYLAKSFRTAAEQQNLPKENDHSLINEAFEKVRKSDLDELFKQVEAESYGQQQASSSDRTIELPVADNFLMYMFHPSTERPEQFRPYLEAVALRYFHLLPYPEIVENCCKSLGGSMYKHFRKTVVDGKLKRLDENNRNGSLGKLSGFLLDKKTVPLDQIIQDDSTDQRCELVYLIHQTVFYATRFIEQGDLDQEYVSVCLHYLNTLLDRLLQVEIELPAQDRKLDEVLRNIFCHRPVLYQHFSIRKERTELRKNVTGLVYQLFKKLQSVESFGQHTVLYSNKIVGELIRSSTLGGDEYILDAGLVEKLLEIFELNERHCVELLQHYANLPHQKFINEKNEKTYHYNLLVGSLIKLAKSYDVFLDEQTMKGLSKIYVDFIRENGNELNLESLEIAILDYLETFSHNIAHLDLDLFRSFFESKRLGKPMVRLAAFLLERDDRYGEAFIELIPGNITKKELIYPLVNVAFRKGVLSNNKDALKKTMTSIYNEFKSGLSKTIEKPGKAAVIYKENHIANSELIKNCMPSNECVDFAKKKLKLDTLEIYQLKLMMEIYRKALESANDDVNQSKVIYVNVFNVLLQFFNILLKASDITKELDKLHELVLVTFSWAETSKNSKHLKNVEFKEITDSSNWNNFCKFSLKLGIDIQKCPDNPYRYDDRLYILLKISAVLVNLFYKDNSSPAELATLYELALTHSRFLDVLLVSFQFRVKTSLVHLLFNIARKNSSVMTKKHIPILLGAYGATLTETNRYVLALIQLYEQSNIHMHEYRPYLWGETAIKQFSLGQESSDKQTLFRTNNSEALSLFSKDNLGNTLRSFPIWRKLDATRQLPDVNFDELVKDSQSPGMIQPQNELERYVEQQQFHRRKNPPAELLEHCAGKREVQAAIYDPSFLLPMMGYLFAPENYDLLDLAGKNGALAIPFACLASDDESMRVAAASVIVRIRGHLELSRKFIDSKFWLHLFNAVQNGVATLNRGKPSNKDKPDNTKKKLPKPAFLPTLFIGETINILPEVLNELHSTLTHYFLLKDTFDFKAVPNFLVMFHSSEVKHNLHRVFIMETIYNGIKSHDDFMILRTSPVIRALLDFYGSPLSNRELNILILNALNSIVKTPKSCEVMVNTLGFLTWISERIESIESFHFDTIEAFLGILSNIWYSVQVQRQSFNVPQLSRTILIIILKFVPLFSTRSSSKTLSRFLNLLEKTTTDKESNLTLVSEKVLQSMMEYFEKLFEQQLWHVKYVLANGNVQHCEESVSLARKLSAQGMEDSTIFVVLSLRRFVIQWLTARNVVKEN
ncbi:uncharacterized protein LOC129747470 [Uranotaenia lowii]|uniref:uncharacterized protein LOC129747470 n=1 Tax=Uranotaenia lowii TaxID=190385 RepID=UPI00247B1F75|nr:uncharacterized protein LOC129747470 [Uranotaenia lowii]